MTTQVEARPAGAGLANALRVLCLIAIAFSSAAFVDGRSGHAFCARGSGCDAVRLSELGEQLSPVLPWFGMIGFSCILFASFSARAGVRRAAWAFAFSGALGGLALLALQGFVIGALCPLCLGADLAALGAGAIAVLLLRRRDAAPAAVPLDVQLGWYAALGVAIALPWSWAGMRPEQPPAFVREHSRPGVVTVVELSDFECPYCRALHPVLDRVLAKNGAKVQHVRISIPLPGHPHARDASRAYHCASAQKRGDDMADVLFTSDALEPADLGAHARALGLNLARFEQCMTDAAVERRIATDVATVIAAGFDGLPCVWIGSTRILGFNFNNGAEPYQAAIERELHGASPWRHAPWLGLIAAALVISWSARRARLKRAR